MVVLIPKAALLVQAHAKINVVFILMLIGWLVIAFFYRWDDGCWCGIA